jgi:RNA polymerase sigma factor (sigma-70 family)
VTAIERLAPRERQVLELLGRGFRYKEIAHELGIAEGTVSEYVERAREALGATTTTEAAVIYTRG